MLGQFIGFGVCIIIAVILTPMVANQLNGVNISSQPIMEKAIKGISNDGHSLLLMAVAIGVGLTILTMVGQMFKSSGIIDDNKDEGLSNWKPKDEDDEEVEHEDLTPTYKIDKNKFKENKWE